MISAQFFRLHSEGWRFGALFLAITAVLWYLWMPLGLLGVLLTAWCFYFFRNPYRTTLLDKSLIISPADGRIQLIREVEPPAELGMGRTPHRRISIFMNVFNVHVNRVPVSGVIQKVHYHKGKFFNASLDKASEHNERQLFMVETSDKMKIGFVQIAGLIGRRILCDVREGDKVTAGQIFGMIRFGSRVDVYIPKSIPLLVTEGQLTVAGETILADVSLKRRIDKRVTQ